MSLLTQTSFWTCSSNALLFHADSASIWSLAEQGKIKASIFAVSLTNIHYICAKVSNRSKALDLVTAIRDTFKLVSCDAQIINQAIDSHMKDFEDAIQYFSALRIPAQCIISRNISHFKGLDIPVMTPTSFSSALFQE